MFSLVRFADHPSEFTMTGNAAKASLASAAPKITVPILVIYGSDDEANFCQDAMVKRFTGSKKVTRVEVQGAKHLPHLDLPDEYFGS